MLHSLRGTIVLMGKARQWDSEEAVTLCLQSRIRETSMNADAQLTFPLSLLFSLGLTPRDGTTYL